MCKVLIVDDEETIRFSFKSILTDAGFSVSAAATLHEAQKKFDTDQFDVAVIDRLLASDDGMSLAKHIFASDRTCSVIIISAFPTFKSAAAGFDYRIFAYLQKPVKKAQLCRVVESAAENTRKLKRSSILEDQLTHAQKMAAVGLQTGNILHDFNNLFMAVNGYADLAAGKQNPDHLEKISRISNQGKKISENFMGFITRTSNEHKTVRANALINSALGLLRLMLPKTIEIRDDFNDDGAYIHVYPTQVEQVIINLGINAMHAMKNQAGCIDVTTQAVTLDPADLERLHMEKSLCIKIGIRDTGCGMTPETVQQIFKPFFSTRNKKSGTGLGLSTAKKIMQKHAGAITVESEPGAGSLFNLYLPVTLENIPENQKTNFINNATY